MKCVCMNILYIYKLYLLILRGCPYYDTFPLMRLLVSFMFRINY